MFFMMIALFYMMVYTAKSNEEGGFNFWKVSIAFYSLWGMWFATISFALSFLATYYSIFHKAAFVMTEISFAVNAFVFGIFWTMLWPLMSATLFKDLESSDPSSAAVLKRYQAAIHFLPFVTTFINLLLTDLTIELDHWKLIMLV